MFYMPIHTEGTKGAQCVDEKQDSDVANEEDEEDEGEK